MTETYVKYFKKQKAVMNVKLTIWRMVVVSLACMLILSIAEQNKVQEKLYNLDSENVDLEERALNAESLLEDYQLYESSLLTYLDEFHVTAYCSCEKCCHDWAKNRPTYNYRELVFTSTGSLAEQGITVAVDPEIIPYGTKLYIEGVGVRIAQDTGSAIKGNRIDVYYADHNEAYTSGLNDRPRKVWIIREDI